MRELHTQVELVIHAPAPTIWAYRLDFLNLPEYNDAVTGLERVDAGADPGPGATYRFDLVTAGRPSPIELRVTEAVPAEVVAIDMDGALPARERFTVGPAPGARPELGPCIAAIELTLLVPDHFPESADAGLVANGEEQMRGELARMGEILEAGGRG